MYNQFTIPNGSIKPIPATKQQEYRNKYAALGPFTKHEYDLDICTMYRQMEELGKRYPEVNGIPFISYVAQIREIVGNELEKKNLDKDFYLNNFYYVIKADDSSYFTHLGLFLALSDPLKIIPILEYHFREFVTSNKEGLGQEQFLGKLEYLVCDFLRRNRFPEDYFAKHEKIMNWLYSKRHFHQYQQQVEDKLESLLVAINRISPKNIPNDILRSKIATTQNGKSQKIAIEKSRVKILYEDIKDYFNKNTHKELLKILNGVVQPSTIIIFQGYANQLADVFRIYSNEKYITGTKQDIAKWMCNHFYYYIESTESPKPFEEGTVKNILYGQDCPPKGKRIKLSELNKEQHTYYPKKKVV